MRSNALNPLQQFSVALWFHTSASFQLHVGDMGEVSQANWLFIRAQLFWMLISLRKLLFKQVISFACVQRWFCQSLRVRLVLAKRSLNASRKLDPLCFAHQSHQEASPLFVSSWSCKNGVVEILQPDQTPWWYHHDDVMIANPEGPLAMSNNVTKQMISEATDKFCPYWGSSGLAISSTQWLWSLLTYILANDAPVTVIGEARSYLEWYTWQMEHSCTAGGIYATPRTRATIRNQSAW